LSVASFQGVFPEVTAYNEHTNFNTGVCDDPAASHKHFIIPWNTKQAQALVTSVT